MQRFRPCGFQLLERQTLWWPTSAGWCVIIIALLVPLVWGVLAGESFLSLTARLPVSQLLAVEGWIGREGVRAAASEFQEHGYEYIATSGGPSSGRWEKDRANYAEMAAAELIASGVPPDRIIIAPCKETESRRTFESARAVLDALDARDLKPTTLTVFTYGSHARRSRLVFAKVFRSATDVGVIAWRPHEDDSEPWWHSSNRAKELLSESAGYIFELFLNSARLTTAPTTEHERVDVNVPVRKQTPLLR